MGRSSKHGDSSGEEDDDASSGSISTGDDGRTRRRRKEKRKERERSKRRSASNSKKSSSSSKKKKEKKQNKDDSKKHNAKKRRRDSDDSDSYSSSSSSSSSDGDRAERRKKRRLVKEAKAILRRHKKDAGGNTNGAHNDSKLKDAVQKVLSEEDYYEKNKEFSTWLKEEHRTYFSNLSSNDTRRLFKDFVEAWNAGRLSKQYYEGMDSATRSSHKWKFKGKKELLVDREEEVEFVKKLEKTQKKKFRKEHEELMDELLPKATGRERQFEKKAIQRESSRLREESPEVFRERDIMGGGDDFKQRLERERAWREKKVAERTEVLKEKQLAFKEKESAAMDQFRALVNVSGGKISIPKRPV